MMRHSSTNYAHALYAHFLMGYVFFSIGLLRFMVVYNGDRDGPGEQSLVLFVLPLFISFTCLFALHLLLTTKPTIVYVLYYSPGVILDYPIMQ